MAEKQIGKISGYHAHVYFEPETRGQAENVRDALDRRFRGAIRLGRWHEKNVGPHTRSMYQVAFAPPLFAEIVPWLALNRGPLAVLVHPESGDAVADHTDHALWLGEILDVDVSVLK
jgi:aromatic ring-cleaving dioxygenase